MVIEMPPTKEQSLRNGANHLVDNTFLDIVKNPKSEEELDTALRFCRKNHMEIDQREIEMVRERFRPSSINRNINRNIKENSVHSVLGENLNRPSTYTARISIRCSDSGEKPLNYQETVRKQRKKYEDNFLKCSDCGTEYYSTEVVKKYKNKRFRCLLINRKCCNIQTENITKNIGNYIEKGSKQSNDIYSAPQKKNYLGNMFNCSQPSTSSTPISKEPHQCAICSVSFDQRKRLMKHAWRCNHYYRCSKCTKKYIPSSESKGRVKAPFECSDLGRVCNNNTRLNEKSLTKNLSTEFANSKLDDYLADGSENYARNVFQCPDCKMYILNFEEFSSHCQIHKEKIPVKRSVGQKTNTETTNLEVVFEEDSFDCSALGNSCFIQPGSLCERIKIYSDEHATQERSTARNTHRKATLFVQKPTPERLSNFAHSEEGDEPVQVVPIVTQSESIKKRLQSKRDNSIQTRVLAKQPKTLPAPSGLENSLQSEEKHNRVQPKILRQKSTPTQSANPKIVQPTVSNEKLTPISHSENSPKTLGYQTDGVLDEPSASTAKSAVFSKTENIEKRVLRNNPRISYFDKNYKCGTCSKSFRESYNLEWHRRTHNVERPYQCLECARRFLQAGHLKTHMHVHTRGKPFQCKICLKYYVREKAYIDHCKLKHNDIPLIKN